MHSRIWRMVLFPRILSSFSLRTISTPTSAMLHFWLGSLFFSHQRINHISQALMHFCEYSDPYFFFYSWLWYQNTMYQLGYASSCTQWYEDIISTAKSIHCQFADSWVRYKWLWLNPEKPLVSRERSWIMGPCFLFYFALILPYIFMFVWGYNFYSYLKLFPSFFLFLY